MKSKQFVTEVVLSLLAAPFLIWFLTFVATTYKTEAEVQNSKADIQEIKTDVKFIRNYLMEMK
jgi:hypothetical protein